MEYYKGEFVFEEDNEDEVQKNPDHELRTIEKNYIDVGEVQKNLQTELNTL